MDKNSGVKVTAKLQKLVLELSKLQKVRVSGLLSGGSGSHHTTGQGVDIGNEEIANDLLPAIATDAKVAELEIDEIIFDARVADAANDRNKWNYDAGTKHDFGAATLDGHKNHIHFSVKS